MKQSTDQSWPEREIPTAKARNIASLAVLHRNSSRVENGKFSLHCKAEKIDYGFQITQFDRMTWMHRTVLTSQQL